MAKFDVDVEGKTYEVDAPDENTAWRWANYTHKQAMQSQPQTQRPSTQEQRTSVRDALLGTPESIERSRSVGTTAVAQGAAGAVDTLLNAPSNIWNLSKAAAGTVAGMAGFPDMMPSISPAPNYAQRAAQSIGLIDPQAAPQTDAERVYAGAGRAMGSMLVAPSVTTASLAMGAGSGAVGQLVEKATGSQVAGQLASMVTPLAAVKAKSYADARTQRLAEREAATSVRDETLQKARDLGFVVAPGDIGSTGVKGWINRRLESIGGKANVRQEIDVRNQEVTNAVGQRVLGLPPGTAITEEILKNYRDRMAGPYREVASLPTLPPERIKGIGGYPLFGPTPKSASQALDELKQARFDSNMAWKDFARNGRTETYKEAAALDRRIESLEGHIEKTAIAAGRPDLVPALQDARTKIAQSWDIDRALNVGNADVSARILARMLDQGKKLSGELETVARFSNAFPRYTTEGSNVHMPTVSKTDVLASIGLGIGGAAVGGPFGAAAGVLPFLSGPVRSTILSRPYQNFMGSQSYTPSLTTQALSRLPMQTEQQAAQQGILLGRGLQQ